MVLPQFEAKIQSWIEIMAEKNQLISYEKIIGKLRHLCGGGATGTFSMATSENHHATISIKNGQIVGATYRSLKGTAALDSIRQINAGLCAFAQGVLRISDEDASLATSKAALEFLGKNGNKASAAAKVANAVAENKTSQVQDDAARKAIAVEATEYLGPIAETICQEHFAMAGSINDKETLRRVLESIADELGDDTKGEEFKKGVMAKLNW